MSDGSQFDGKKFANDLRSQIHEEVRQNFGARPRPQWNRGGIIPGIILIAVGAIFLLDHLGYVHAEQFWKFWPLILVAVGIRKFFERAVLSGIAITLVGVILLLNQLGYTTLSWGELWPFLLIFAGAQMIWHRYGTAPPPKSPNFAGADANDTLHDVALFGGVDRSVNSQHFRGGTISATFGGVELDFRNAEIEGEQADLFLDATFGGVEITVPDRWNVVFDIQSIFAGYSDDRSPAPPDPLNTAPKKTLVLHGRAVFGGISVKN